MRGDKTGNRGYSLTGEAADSFQKGFLFYKASMSSGKQSLISFLPFHPSCHRCPCVFKLCIFSKSLHASLLYVDSHGKIHYPHYNVTAELFRNASALNSRVFAFWEQLYEWSQEAKRNRSQEHSWNMCRICWAVLWKWNGWFSESDKIYRLVDSFRQVCLDKKSWHLAASPCKTNFACLLP